jgi:hypothetical protein
VGPGCQPAFLIGFNSKNPKENSNVLKNNPENT